MEAVKQTNTNNLRKLIYGSYLGYKATRYIIGVGGAATRHATQNLKNKKKAQLYATAALAGIGAVSFLTIKNARDSFTDIKSTNSYYKRHKNDFKRKKKK